MENPPIFKFGKPLHCFAVRAARKMSAVSSVNHLFRLGPWLSIQSHENPHEFLSGSPHKIQAFYFNAIEILGRPRPLENWKSRTHMMTHSGHIMGYVTCIYMYSTCTYNYIKIHVYKTYM